MSAVNNVTRILDARKINYTAFELPAEKLSGIETARKLRVSQAKVFKTIVITRDKPKRPVLVMVPSSSEVDLKEVAAALGEKKVWLPTEHEAEVLTGLQAGGISPLALLHKGFRVLLDSSAMAQGQIHVSGGQRGLNIRLSAADLIDVTGAQLARVANVGLGAATHH